MTQNYLIQHNMVPTISASGKLQFKVGDFTPASGVAVTSLTNKKYVVGAKGNLERV